MDALTLLRVIAVGLFPLSLLLIFMGIVGIAEQAQEGANACSCLVLMYFILSGALLCYAFFYWLVTFIL